MQEQKKGTKNLTRTCPTALPLYFPFSFTLVLVRRGRRVHLLQQISRLLLLAQYTKCAAVMEVVVAGAAAIFKKTFRGCEKKTGRPGEGK